MNWIIVTGITVLGLIIPVFAQSPASGDQPALAPVKTTVVVTATRSEEDAHQSPVAITVITREDIATQPASTIDQHLNYIPGLNIQRTKGPADSIAKAQLRGFSGPNRTLVLLDGQPLNDSYSGTVNWSALPLDEIQSVEVVRGPFSSLYGGEALGGVINILTRPVDYREFELRGEHGSYDTTGYGVRYADRFFNRLGLSFGYERLQYGGYQGTPATATASAASGASPITGVAPTLTTQGSRSYLLGWNGANWSNSHTLRAKGEYTFGDSTIVTAQYLLMRYGSGFDSYTSNLRDASGAIVDRGTYTFNDQGTIRTITVTPAKFLVAGPVGQYNHFWAVTAQHRFSRERIFRLDAGYYNTPAYNYRTPGSSATAAGGVGTQSFTARRALHGNAQYNAGFGRHSFVGGAEFRHDTATNSVFNLGDWTQTSTRLNQTYLAAGRSVNQSAYVQDRIELAERLKLVAGGRFDYWRTYDGRYNTYTSASSLTTLGDRSQNAFTGKLALTYSLAGTWDLRASAGTAFRSPTIYDLYGTTVLSGITYQSNPALKPERVRSWEAGMRKRYRSADIDVTYYENYLRDMIYRTTDLNANPIGLIRVNVNAGAARTRGVEAALQQALTKWLQLRCNYTYTDAIVTRNPATPASVGKRVLYIPEHMASAQLLGHYGRWTGSLATRYAGATFGTDANLDTTKGVFGAYDPYLLTEASLGFQATRRLQVYSEGGNLLNRRYYVYYLAPGRTATIGFRLKL